MPKGLRTGGPCPGCGAKGNRCKATCSTRAIDRQSRGEKPATAAARPAPKKRASPATSRELAGLEVEDLLELRSEVDGELKRRKDEAEEQLRKLNAAIGEAA